MDFSGLSNLFQNNLFRQYLSAAGAGLAHDVPAVQALNAVTQQNIGAQSQSGLNQKYMQMLQGMMSGKIPEGGKVVQTDKGTKIEIPQAALENVGVGEAKPEQGLTIPDMAKLGNLNPFPSSQLGISATDLAGLGSQDVSRALSGATNVEALRQQSIANLFKARPDPLEQGFPIPHPDVGTMSLRQWQSLPADEKEFASYVHAAKKLGAPKEELTRRFFSTLEPTEREQFIRATMKDPKLKAVAKELARSGATTISIGEKVAGKVAEKKALGKLEGQLHLNDPAWIDSIDKHLDSKDMQRKIFMESQKEGGDPELIKAKEIVKFIERKISVGGTIQNVKISEDGRTMTWTVKWKSGDIEDISYVVRP